MVFPHVETAHFIAGGSAGSGVLLVRDASSGHWVGPAFYALDEVDVGVQVGLGRREVVAVLRDCSGLAALESDGARVRLGTSLAMQAAERVLRPHAAHRRNPVARAPMRRALARNPHGRRAGGQVSVVASA
jgi:lipid-binding SYLF domain-containing protein